MVFKLQSKDPERLGIVEGSRESLGFFWDGKNTISIVCRLRGYGIERKRSNIIEREDGDEGETQSESTNFWKQELALPLYLFNIVLEILAGALTDLKKVKEIQIWRQSTYFQKYDSVHKWPKNSTMKLWKLRCTFSKVTGYKINSYLLLLYIWVTYGVRKKAGIRNTVASII